jgi:2-methylcitrate dehydratase PrpD
VKIASRLRAMARRIRLAETAELEARFPESRSARVTLETVRGSFTETVHYPRGSVENPLSAEWLTGRATVSLGERLGARAAKQCVEDLLGLEPLERTAPLANRLCAPC